MDDAFLTKKSKRPPRLIERDEATKPRRGLTGGWLPIPIFLVTACVFAILWPVMPIVPAAIAVLATISACYHHTAQMGSSAGQQQPEDEMKADVADLVFTTLLLAVIMGVLTGCYAAEQHMQSFYAISFSQSYTGVDARSNGAAYRDAGEISFDLSAIADTEQSLGFKDHSVFCVAPVLDASDQVSNVYFWAVGYDCCSSRGGFDCGGVSPGTRGGGGIRLSPDDGPLGRFGLFGHPQTAEFLAAVKQAAAVYELPLPTDDDEIVMLEWVRSTSEVQFFHVLRAIGTIAMGSLLFMLMVIVLSIVYRYRMGTGNRARNESESLPK